ncbi:hypothetical protein [Serratia silvae]|uniref:Secreted protein n=1 Tax=Serratia silvae TaxID=2824122 RepID=A0ABT0KD71_9GAMM|nr:hypothetical protein [Serratia silvae]MCL1029970.1 hypothetical protein [Serratia silvae]
MAATGRFAALGGLLDMQCAFSPKIAELAPAGFNQICRFFTQITPPNKECNSQASRRCATKKEFVIVLLTDLGLVRRGLYQGNKVNLGVFCTVTVRQGKLLVQVIKVVAATCNPCKAK